ncbi:MAG TPA: 3-dehydroquinate synthase [bacterium]
MSRRHRAIRVSLGPRSYPIVLAGSFAGLPGEMRRLALPRLAWVVSHARLLATHGRPLCASLERGGWTVRVITVPESERAKSFATARRVMARVARGSPMRVPVLVAFGGGVVGDLAGFVASVYRRGVPYVQVATTLLAQVDSAIGGKVAIDLPEGKNLIGAYHQPRLVWNHLGLLRTLPPRQRRSGLAEVLKYGVIADPWLWRYLERRLDACLALTPGAARVMVERSCAVKARVVSLDERETRGPRLHLNYGHTIGHALETVTGYRRFTHGEAIAVGMCAAAHLSAALGRCSSGDADRIESLILAAGLPVRADGVDPEAVLMALRYDKKFVRGRARWVLPTRIGRVIVAEDVPEAAVRATVRRYVRKRGGVRHG